MRVCAPDKGLKGCTLLATGHRYPLCVFLARGRMVFGTAEHDRKGSDEGVLAAAA